jgi:hypothetical protein
LGGVAAVGGCYFSAVIGCCYWLSLAVSATASRLFRYCNWKAIQLTNGIQVTRFFDILIPDIYLFHKGAEQLSIVFCAQLKRFNSQS